jgi:hypothetical protein
VAQPDGSEPFREWCIVQLMGHVRLGGLVTEQAMAGGHWLRLDVYRTGAGQPVMTKLIPPPPGGPVYDLTPVTEELARAVADRQAPAPVARFELPGGVQAETWERDDDDFGEGDDG